MFSASTPAATSPCANASTSSHGRDSGISSAPVIRNRTGKPSPTASRTALATSIPNRIRPSASPPQESSRLFVTGERNWSTRYPSDPITSTAANPSSCASRAPAANCATTSQTSSSPSARGSTRDTRLATAEGATTSPGESASA